MSYKDTDQCLAKAAPDEMLFVLRAQDITAPRIVMEWIKENFYQTPDDKLREAFEAALEMKKWANRKTPD